MSQNPSQQARSRVGRIYWRIAEGLPPAWRPGFARFATTVAHGRRAVRRVRRRTWRRAYRWARPMLRQRAGVRLVQRLARRFPPVRLPGSGPVWLVDARGVATAQVAEVVGERLRRVGGARLVALVDDPRVDQLRSAGVVYEYVPAALAGSELEARRELITWSYGIARSVLFTEL